MERHELEMQWWEYPLPTIEAFESNADDSTPNMTEYINVSYFIYSSFIFGSVYLIHLCRRFKLSYSYFK